MRSTFGRFAMELRAKRGISQTEFSQQTGMSLSRISNIEFQRASVSDDVIRVYIKALNCSGSEACELRKRAIFANTVKRVTENGVKYPPLLALFEQFGDRISPKAAAEIQRILERETGEEVEALAFSSTAMTKYARRTKKGKRPDIMPRRFAEICLLAYDVRQSVCSDMSKVKIDLALEVLSTASENLDFAVVEALPSYVDGAFACITGASDGHTILVEEKRFLSALRGVHFARHVVAHELGNHYLHADLLVSESTAFLPPQELSKNNCEMIKTDRQICQVVDTMPELEAEIFATFFLVPWLAFLKGTGQNYLADDYGEQLDEVKRYAPYFKNPAVVDAFKDALWTRGERRHPIFSMN